MDMKSFSAMAQSVFKDFDKLPANEQARIYQEIVGGRQNDPPLPAHKCKKAIENVNAAEDLPKGADWKLLCSLASNEGYMQGLYDLGVVPALKKAAAACEGKPNEVECFTLCVHALAEVAMNNDNRVRMINNDDMVAFFANYLAETYPIGVRLMAVKGLAELAAQADLLDDEKEIAALCPTIFSPATLRLVAKLLVDSRLTLKFYKQEGKVAVPMEVLYSELSLRFVCLLGQTLVAHTAIFNDDPSAAAAEALSDVVLESVLPAVRLLLRSKSTIVSRMAKDALQMLQHCGSKLPGTRPAKLSSLFPDAHDESGCGHSHSHDGNDHGHSHGGNDHGHSHGRNDHGHSHDGNDHGHSHSGNDHGHSHDGPGGCSGHGHSAQTGAAAGLSRAEYRASSTVATAWPQCSACGKPESPAVGFKRCGGCQVALYCNKDCQLVHWKAGHKDECTRLGDEKKEAKAQQKEVVKALNKGKGKGKSKKK